MKKTIAILILLALIVLPTTTSANFYVIPAGKRATDTVLVSPKSIREKSGQALLDALAKITSASETNPYLIAIEPGIDNVVQLLAQLSKGQDRPCRTIRSVLPGPTTDRL